MLDVNKLAKGDRIVVKEDEERDYLDSFDRIAYARNIAYGLDKLGEMGLLKGQYDELNGEFWGPDYDYDDYDDYDY